MKTPKGKSKEVVFGYYSAQICMEYSPLHGEWIMDFGASHS